MSNFNLNDELDTEFEIPPSSEQHVIHHYYHHDPIAPSLTIRGERNTKGWNIEIGVSGARTVVEAMQLIDALRTEAEHRFGTGVAVVA